jgi:multiple sugar transport system substrate-binding protein
MQRAIRLLMLAVSIGCTPTPRGDATALRFVAAKPGQPAVWDEAIRRFEAAHPEIRVERELGPASSTAFHDLLTQKLKNRDPSVDVYFMDVVWPAEFAAAGWALALDDRFPAGERARFLDGAIRAGTWRGRVYGVPAFVDAGMLYYRKDLLERYGLAVPATWPELERAARLVVEREHRPGLVGYSAQLKQYEGLVCNLLELVVANGGAIVDDRRGRAAIERPEAVAAVRWVRDHVVGGIAPRGVLTYQEPESIALFLEGDAVFHRNWPYAWQIANDPSHSRVAGKVGIAPLPRFEHGQSAAALGGWQYGISAFSPRADEAWEFIAFMTSEAMQKYFATEASLAPTREALYRDPEVVARHPELAQAEAFRRAVPRPVTPVYPAVSHVLQRYFSSAIADPGSDVEELAGVASVEIDRLLALAGESEPAP